MTSTHEHQDTPAQAQARAEAHDRAKLERWIHQDTKRVERLARLLVGPLAQWGYRLKAYGLEHVPASGPFIMVANHSSYMDPFLLMKSHQVVRFMAKASLFEYPVMRTLMAGGGGFPVRRGKGDTFAMELARSLLADGQPVAMFPEGTRFRTSDELGPPKRGAARLAIETGVPVVPVALYGAKPRAARGMSTLPPRLPRITIAYGEQMCFSSDADVDSVRDEIWAEVHRLHGVARELGRRKVRPRSFIVPPRAQARSTAAHEVRSSSLAAG